MQEEQQQENEFLISNHCKKHQHSLFICTNHIIIRNIIRYIPVRKDIAPTGCKEGHH
jgi:hypothetical protein